MRSYNWVWHPDLMMNVQLCNLFSSEGRLIIPVKGSHSGGFMVVLTQLDTVLVLWQVKTQVPVRLGEVLYSP